MSKFPTHTVLGQGPSCSLSEIGTPPWSEQSFLGARVAGGLSVLKVYNHEQRELIPSRRPSCPLVPSSCVRESGLNSLNFGACADERAISPGSGFSVRLWMGAVFISGNKFPGEVSGPGTIGAGEAAVASVPNHSLGLLCKVSYQPQPRT